MSLSECNGCTNWCQECSTFEYIGLTCLSGTKVKKRKIIEGKIGKQRIHRTKSSNLALGNHFMYSIAS